MQLLLQDQVRFLTSFEEKIFFLNVFFFCLLVIEQFAYSLSFFFPSLAAAGGMSMGAAGAAAGTGAAAAPGAAGASGTETGAAAASTATGAAGSGGETAAA